MLMVARALQVLGLIIAPMGLFYGFEHRSEPGAAARELAVLAAGVGLFLSGRFLEGRAAR